MIGFRIAAFFVTALVALGTAASSFAQKDKDTLRFTITEQVRSLDSYTFALREGSFMYGNVYDGLVVFDERGKKYVPALAKSWKQPSPGVYEFELRDDLIFHNGNPFDADDVKTTVDWMISPEEKRIHEKHRYTWVKSVEKLGSHKVRITSNRPSPIDLTLLSLRYPIYDSQSLNALQDKVDYGRQKAVGTGPYKAVSIGTERVVFEGFENYKADSPFRQKARIGRIIGMVIPDTSAQIAQLMVGNVEVKRDPTQDQVRDLLNMPNLTVTASPSLVMTFLQFDAAGRSGKKQLQDVRVRRALAMAIDRNALKAIVPGGKVAEVMNAMCFRAMIGCDVDVVPPPSFDPAGARRLLAEAGYPGGFDIKITTPQVTRDIAVAVSGYWKEIGVTASVETVTVGVLRKRRASGELEALAMYRTYQNIPDASGLMDSFYYGTTRDFTRDSVIDGIGRKADTTFDLADRERLYKQVLDRTNDQMFLLPVTSLPTLLVHAKSVKVHANPLSENDTRMGDFGWN